MRFIPIAMLLTLIVVSTPAVSMETTSDLTNSNSSNTINSLNNDLTIDEKITIVDQHIVTYSTPPMILIQYMVHENNGEQFRYWEYDGGRAFQIACEYYAMYTLDFDVSVGELVDAGFWPYDFFPENMNYDLHFHTNLEEVDILVTNSLNSGALRQSEQEYLLEAKSNILRWFHKCYFFETDQPRDISADELASHRIEAFWINPISNESIKERPGLGDCQLYDVMRFASDFEKILFDYDVMIPVINQHSTFSVNELNNYTVDETSQLTGIYERVFDVHCGRWPSTKTYNVVFPNTDDINNPFTLTWQVTSGAYFSSHYELVRYVTTKDTGSLHTGEISKTIGHRLPSTIYSWRGDYVSIISDTYPEYDVTSNLFTKEQNDHLNFISCLNCGRDGGVATAPGPVCE